MFKKIILLLLFPIFIKAQSKDGYWDNIRTTNETIILKAGEKKTFKTADFPVGTTEVVFRITLLNDSQQITNSLVSVLKAVPDPTGISQGSAGALLILSKISGDDQCIYSIYNNEEKAKTYVEKGKQNQACFIQNNSVSKDAKVLAVNKSTCFDNNNNNNGFWFVFESKNWVMSQKMVIEVVPWVDYKLSKGWNVKNKKTIIDQCKTSNLAQKITNSDDFCVCILDKIQNKYKYQEFQELLVAEQVKLFKDFGNNCLNETTVSDETYIDLRNAAITLQKEGKYNDAIVKLLPIVNEGKANALDCNVLGTCYLLTKQYEKAIKFLKEGEIKDNSELLIKLNLAHAYLLNDNYKIAKTIYKQYQLQNVNDSLSWYEKNKQDFELFQKIGIQNDDFERVLKMIKN